MPCLRGTERAAPAGCGWWLGASLPKSTSGWLSLAFLALGPGAVAAVSRSYSMSMTTGTSHIGSSNQHRLSDQVLVNTPNPSSAAAESPQ